MTTTSPITTNPGVRAALERLGRTVNPPGNELKDDDAAMEMGLMYIGYISITQGGAEQAVLLLDVCTKAFETGYEGAQWDLGHG